MAEELQLASRTDNKRKYEDQATPPPPSSAPRRATGFSAPITSKSPDSTHAVPPPSYNSVAPPMDEIQLAKQRAQEIAARLFSNASNAEAKRPRGENGGSDESNNSAFSDHGQKPSNQQVGIAPASAMPFNFGFHASASKKIEIPNGRVGVIIGKAGETIKYLQLQSGAKIQVTRDMDADPNSSTRLVELMGTSDQISKAEQLINDVLSEAESGGSGLVSRRLPGQSGSEQFTMQVPNNKVGLIIGKGGETIKNMQAKSGARIQLIPLHLPPGDTSTERTVQIEGTKEQIESAKQLISEVTSETRVRNHSMGGGYSQQGYRPPRPPTSWGPPGAPMQQPGYGYMQPGAYSGQPPQYNMSQPPYTGYPPQQSSGGYSSGWDQTPVPPNQQSAPGSGYDYYSQQPSTQQQPSQGVSSTPADNTGYNYGQPPASGYNQQGAYGESNYTQAPVGQQQGYPQDSYGGGYNTSASQPGYGQQQSNPQPGYDQQQGYNSAPSYGSAVNPTQDGAAPAYGATGGTAQVPSAQQVPSPVQPSASSQQGYTGQQPSTTPSSYPPQVTAPPGYGIPPTSQPGYGGQPPVQTGYGQSAPLTQPSYGPPQPQKPPSSQPVYGQQTQQPPSTQGGYAQPTPVQSGYSHSQPLPAQPGYTQPDASHHRPPTSGFGSAAPPPGYGQQSYGAPTAAQPGGYGQQQQQSYNDAYGAGYSQPPVYSTEGTAGTHGSYDGPPGSQAVPQSGIAKTSPRS